MTETEAGYVHAGSSFAWTKHSDIGADNLVRSWAHASSASRLSMIGLCISDTAGDRAQVRRRGRERDALCRLHRHPGTPRHQGRGQARSQLPPDHKGCNFEIGVQSIADTMYLPAPIIPDTAEIAGPHNLLRVQLQTLPEMEDL